MNERNLLRLAFWACIVLALLSLHYANATPRAAHVGACGSQRCFYNVPRKFLTDYLRAERWYRAFYERDDRLSDVPRRRRSAR